MSRENYDIYAYVVSEREYIFACILNELYKQTEYYNNHLTEHGFPLRQSPGFPVDPPQAPPPPQHGGQWWQRC